MLKSNMIIELIQCFLDPWGIIKSRRLRGDSLSTAKGRQRLKPFYYSLLEMICAACTVVGGIHRLASVMNSRGNGLRSF